MLSSVRWALRGNARQRVLFAWHMGWEPAVQVSGSHWIAPYLGQLLQDPYDVVRYVASRSLRRLPEYRELPYNWLGPQQQRADATRRAREIWKQLPRSEQPRGQVLLRPDGTLHQDLFDRLLQQRDDRLVGVEE